MSDTYKSPVLGRAPSIINIETRSDSEYEQQIEYIASNLNDGVVMIESSQVVEKRPRQESEELEQEEAFSIVNRRSKQLRRSLSALENDLHITKNIDSVQDKYEVCVSSKELLPRQIALAKLLRSQNIQHIHKIKFKSPYKVLISFNSKDEAEKLMKCDKMQELDYKCYMTSEAHFCYGVVKGIDLELDLKEVQKALNCESEIISMRRLKRQTKEHQWVDSEAVRICFKSKTLPKYVRGYGCQFDVEIYNYPVSQCSGCWRFGHLIKQCPTKKIFCPKCGLKHPNCMVTDFCCINCKGKHMAFDKKCPKFLKEKQIREIMSKETCDYKKALLLYNEKENTEEADKDLTPMDVPFTRPQDIDRKARSYRDVVVTNAVIHREEEDTEMDSDSMQSNYESEILTEQNNISRNKRNNRKKKKKKQLHSNFTNVVEQLGDRTQNKSTSMNKNKLSDYKKEEENEHWFLKMYMKIKEIIASKNKLEEKLLIFVKYIIGELQVYIFKYLGDEGLIGNILSRLVNG